MGSNLAGPIKDNGAVLEIETKIFATVIDRRYRRGC
jgi:hypothetical protein